MVRSLILLKRERLNVWKDRSNLRLANIKFSVGTEYEERKNRYNCTGFSRFVLPSPFYMLLLAKCSKRVQKIENVPVLRKYDAPHLFGKFVEDWNWDRRPISHFAQRHQPLCNLEVTG